MQYKLKEEFTVMHEQIVVDFFLILHKKWFENKSNAFYNKKDKFRKYLLQYIDNRELLTNGDSDIVYCVGKFNDYMKWYDPIL